jgi:hypothetical protein
MLSQGPMMGLDSGNAGRKRSLSTGIMHERPRDCKLATRQVGMQRAFSRVLT